MKIIRVIVFALLLPLAWLIARYGWEYLHPYYGVRLPMRRAEER